jgi:choline dehydrogenase-like flavoprotein
MPDNDFQPEFIVVGSGAGGGTVAARLAESGRRVLLLEAGGDPREGAGGGRTSADDYDVPAFHPFATEQASMRWDFFVRHYDEDARQRRDPNYCETWNGSRVDGVYYPRAGTLGGCTAHNAMILVCPHDSDWNQLADLTGDRSWRAEPMRALFQRIEHCDYRPGDRVLARLGANPSGHGWNGWLNTERPTPRAVLRDDRVRTTIVESARAALAHASEKSRFRLVTLSNTEADPNDVKVAANEDVGVRFTPLTTHNGVRVGSRERLLDVQRRFPDLLKIELHALATRVLFDDAHRAIGVEYLTGERLYRADPNPSTQTGTRREAFASREVILAGGVFNTPQLLMLSGIGPADELTRNGIGVRVDLQGVGRNLQDRYEVSAMYRMAFDAWPVLEGATYSAGDRHYRDWANDHSGPYTTNGAMLAVVLRSSLDRPVPDLFCYGIIAPFTGYYPGYSSKFLNNPNCLTWVVLKGHTSNTAGRVTLRSADPRDRPHVSFRYFDEGNDAAGDDLTSVVDGLQFVRSLSARLRQEGLIDREESPGEHITSPDQLRQFVRDTAWGHHASCTCPIGRRELGGVLTPDLKVHGTRGLRVVDASVFPRIPGLFIASAVYMVGEKAADMILAEG